MRLEIARALARGIPVIPVLVGGAGLPKKSELPDDLKALVDHQVATVTTNGFRAEMACLERDINTLLGPRRRWPWAAGVAGVLAAGTGFAMYAGLIPMMGLGSLLYPGATTTASDDYCSPGAYDGYQSLRADLDGDGTEELVFAGAQMAFTHAAAKTPSGYDCAKRASSRIGDTPTSYEGFKASLADKTGDDIPDLVMTKGTEAWVHAGRRDGTFAEGSAGRVAMAEVAIPSAEVDEPSTTSTSDPSKPGGSKLTVAEARRKVEGARTKAAEARGRVEDLKGAAVPNASKDEAPFQDHNEAAAKFAAELKAGEERFKAKQIADAKASAAAKKAGDEAFEAAARAGLSFEQQVKASTTAAGDAAGKVYEEAKPAIAPPAAQPPTTCESGTLTKVAGQTRCLKPGDEFKDCDECPLMVVVPAGEFLMGSPESEEGRKADEGPQRKVTISRAFAVGKFEVTFSEWDACVTARKCKYNPGDEGWGRGRRPVINVSQDDAQQYIAWLSKKTDKSYRLLSEAEWEFAARAGNETPFSTGSAITSDQANFNGNQTYGGSSKGKYREKTLEVGSFGPNAFGLNDMHGNVWEWVDGCYEESYESAPIDGSVAKGSVGCSGVLRGGSWINYPRYLRAAYRSRDLTFARTGHFGFRLARTLNPNP